MFATAHRATMGRVTFDNRKCAVCSLCIQRTLRLLGLRAKGPPHDSLGRRPRWTAQNNWSAEGATHTRTTTSRGHDPTENHHADAQPPTSRRHRQRSPRKHPHHHNGLRCPPRHLPCNALPRRQRRGWHHRGHVHQTKSSLSWPINGLLVQNAKRIRLLARLPRKTKENRTPQARQTSPAAKPTRLTEKLNNSPTEKLIEPQVSFPRHNALHRDKTIRAPPLLPFPKYPLS